ncbi:MAG: hypothetical protein WCS41_02945 [Candidatus Paceibacterota bacterium]
MEYRPGFPVKPGMTEEGVGMTEEGVGMTEEGVGMTEEGVGMTGRGAGITGGGAGMAEEGRIKHRIDLNPLFRGGDKRGGRDDREKRRE